MESVTTLATLTSWTLIRGGVRAFSLLVQSLLEILAWLALAVVGAMMLCRWSWRPLRRSAAALVSATYSLRD
jgi:hypothetical protein